jgi:hypothetical protein
MPECLLLAYHDSLDRLRAERLLDDAQTSSVPHLNQDGRRSWYRSVARRVARPVLTPAAGGETPVPAGGALFTVNGRPTDKYGLARWLAQAFGVQAPPRGALPDRHGR